MLLEPICIENCQVENINTKFGWTCNGFPIISGIHRDFEEDDMILAWDRATSYFDDLTVQFREQKNINAIKPLAGWAEDSDGVD